MPLSVDRFPNRLATKVPTNIPRNPPFFSFNSFLIVSLTLFIDHSDSSKGSTVLMISFISLLKIINVVKSDPNIFL